MTEGEAGSARYGTRHPSAVVPTADAEIPGLPGQEVETMGTDHTTAAAPVDRSASDAGNRGDGSTAPTQFADRHIGLDSPGLATMLHLLDQQSLDGLELAAVPSIIRHASPLELPPPASEAEALSELRALAARNTPMVQMIGMGYHDTLVPAVIKRNVLENPAWYTAYTPYQPALGDLRLVGRVGRVPGGVLQHVALDHRRDEGVVVAHPDHLDHRGVACGQCPQFGERFGLGGGRWELERAGVADDRRHRCEFESVQALLVKQVQHRGEARGVEPDVPVGELRRRGAAVAAVAGVRCAAVDRCGCGRVVCAHGLHLLPGQAGDLRVCGGDHRGRMTSAVPGGPGLPLCHRSLRASPLTRFAPSARRPAGGPGRAPSFQRCLSPAVRWPERLAGRACSFGVRCHDGARFRTLPRGVGDEPDGTSRSAYGRRSRDRCHSDRMALDSKWRAEKGNTENGNTRSPGN